MMLCPSPHLRSGHASAKLWGRLPEALAARGWLSPPNGHPGCGPHRASSTNDPSKEQGARAAKIQPAETLPRNRIERSLMRPEAHRRGCKFFSAIAHVGRQYAGMLQSGYSQCPNAECYTATVPGELLLHDIYDKLTSSALLEFLLQKTLTSARRKSCICLPTVRARVERWDRTHNQQYPVPPNALGVAS